MSNGIKDEGTTRLTPSMRNRMLENRHNGRQYNTQGTSPHLIPNDDDELYRLNTQHKAITEFRKRLHEAPVRPYQRVLDSGCGLGYWAIEFADANPDSQVIGVDIAPIQLEEIPPNLAFECDDVCQGLRFPDNYFDLVYSRDMSSSLINWPRYLAELMRILKPGGHLNCVESDICTTLDPSTKGTTYARWVAGLVQTYRALGLNPLAATGLRAVMEKVGLHVLEEQFFLLPGGSATRANAAEQETARLMTQAKLIGLSALIKPYGAANNLYDQDLDLFVAEVRRDLVDPSIIWNNFWVSVVASKQVAASGKYCGTRSCRS